MICKLCEENQASKFCENSAREFYRCANCELIFVPEIYHLNRIEEKARYDLHDNSADNSGYVNYLEKIAILVSARILKDQSILDFGSGREAVLNTLLKKNGYDCTAYDPLYDHNTIPKNRIFDVIIACEVVEHLRDLRSELLMMRKLVSEKSKIIIRTQTYPSPEKFLKWWYIQDLTHINFFSLKSINFAGQILGCDIEQTAELDIFVLKRK
jgi:2-polyprenyl-3-methyl-5-hydroxy-6-metoxy-1,4-benzoquinol methylase